MISMFIVCGLFVAGFLTHHVRIVSGFQIYGYLDRTFIGNRYKVVILKEYSKH